jgi:hypothetical protein
MSNASGGAARQDLGACVHASSRVSRMMERRGTPVVVFFFAILDFCVAAHYALENVNGPAESSFPVLWRNRLSSRSFHSLTRVVNRLHIRYEITVIGRYG